VPTTNLDVFCFHCIGTSSAVVKRNAKSRHPWFIPVMGELSVIYYYVVRCEFFIDTLYWGEEVPFNN
jgi:hypothetical protein